MTRPTESEVREWLARLANSGLPDATLARRVCEDWLRTNAEATTCKHGTLAEAHCEECEAEDNEFLIDMTPEPVDHETLDFLRRAQEPPHA